MSSHDHAPHYDARSRRVARFITAARMALKEAVAEAGKAGVSQAEIARRLGISPSVITRRLNGTANLTLRSLAELSWALDRYPRLRLCTEAELKRDGDNGPVRPAFPNVMAVAVGAGNIPPRVTHQTTTYTIK